MVCRKCGFECGEANFCPNCGNDLTEQRRDQGTQYGPNNGGYQQGGYGQGGYYDPRSSQDPYSRAQADDPYFQRPYYPPYMPQNPPGKSMATASLVLGILSLVAAEFGLILAILAIVFGVISKRRGFQSGMSTAGICCGIVCLVLYACGIIILLAGLSLLL